MDIGTTISKYLTPEVLTVLAVLICAALGWRVTKGGLNLIGALATRAGFVGMTAAILFIGGIGSTGLGVGEIVCRISNAETTPKDKGIRDADLLKLAEKCQDKETAKILLEYARVRDGDKANEDVRILSVMVDKQVANNGDKDNKALVAFIDYLKAKEQTKQTRTRLRDTLVSTNGEDSTFPDESVAKVETKVIPNKDSMVSIPTSLAMIGLGIGSTLCGLCVFRLRKESATETPTAA